MKLKRIVVLLAVVAGLSGTVAETCPVIPFVAVTGRPAEADVVRKVARLKEMGYDTHLGVVGSCGYGHGSCADVATRRAPFGRGMVYYEENPTTNPFISPVRSVC